MIALRLSVPFARWCRPRAGSYNESLTHPTIATVYGCLLSAVGEYDRSAHVGVRVTIGVIRQGDVSTLLYKKIKKTDKPLKEQDRRLDFLRTLRKVDVVTNSELLIYVDSSSEGGTRLEDRLVQALRDPGSVVREGVWCLGYSDDMIDDHELYTDSFPASDVFLLDDEGDISIPVWVDHWSQKMSSVLGSFEANSGPPKDRVPLVTPPK